ncbi:MAG TPA: potassium channel protein [Longimicrobium sp.]|jgi:voltage-gated potassium channel
MLSDLRLLRRRLATGAAFLVGLVVLGAAGYRILVPSASWLDVLYMTVITLTTVGYSEIFDITHNPAARWFTMLLILFGIGGAGYFLSTVTAFIFEGQLHDVFWRRRMTTEISRLSGHLIVCGSDETAIYAVQELLQVKRDAVLVCDDPGRVAALREQFPTLPITVGDPTADEVLASAGIARASGILVCTRSDKDNLIVTLTARQLNPAIRIVSRVEDVTTTGKVRNVGANAVVSPKFIGGLRMVSELIRPTVVTFLDEMLRDREKNLRIEEVPITEGSPLVERTLADFDLRATSSALLLACREDGKPWIYNPPPSLRITPGLVLILMGSPEDMAAVRKLVS